MTIRGESKAAGGTSSPRRGAEETVEQDASQAR